MENSGKPTVRVRYAENVAGEIIGVYERISKAASNYSVARGSVNGHEVDDWLLAERTLIIKPAVQVRRENTEYVVEMPIPEASVPDLNIHITPNQFLATSSACNDGRQVFRLIRFPETINPATVDVNVTAGKLRIVMSIAS